MTDYGAAGPDANPQLSAKFRIEIDGINLGAVQKATIDGSEWNTMNARTGIDDLDSLTASATKKVHVMTIEKNLVEGGESDIQAFMDWHDAGSSERKTGALVPLGRDGNEVLRITFAKGWLKKVTFPQFDAEDEAGPLTYTFEIEFSKLSHEAA